MEVVSARWTWEGRLGSTYGETSASVMQSPQLNSLAARKNKYVALDVALYPNSLEGGIRLVASPVAPSWNGEVKANSHFNKEKIKEYYNNRDYSNLVINYNSKINILPSNSKTNYKNKLEIKRTFTNN
jgi:hypothetical protein